MTLFKGEKKGKLACRVNVEQFEMFEMLTRRCLSLHKNARYILIRAIFKYICILFLLQMMLFDKLYNLNYSKTIRLEVNCSKHLDISVDQIFRDART